ncbi:MAG: hypothetical protein AB7F59_04220 [Bdellovibrionales bacterium]
MRVLLISFIIFSAVLDACYAEDIFQGLAVFAGIEAQKVCADHSCTVTTSDSQSTSEHDTHTTCHQCPTCHVFIAMRPFVSQATLVENIKYFPYVFSVSHPYAKTLKRPPKA